MIVADRCLAKRDQEVLGNDGAVAGHDDQQPIIISAQFHVGADQQD